MPTSLAEKLQLKPDMRVAVLNAPAGYLEKLAAGLAGIAVSAAATDQAGVLLLFVNSLAEAERLAPGAIRALKPGGLFWVAYARGTSGVKTDVNRDRLWQAMEPTGWRPVRQVALDDVWSAMHFRPADQVCR